MTKAEGKESKSDERKADEADLARNPCDKKKPCTTPPQPGPCSQGEASDKNGKCVGAAKPAAATTAQTQPCPPGEERVAGGCTQHCPAGQIWTGGACAECASFQSRASLISTEAFGVKSEMEAECRRNPTGQRCQELTLEHDGVVLRYRMLLNEAPFACHASMPDPLTL